MTDYDFDLSESVTASDSLMKGASETLAESATASDTPTVSFGRTFAVADSASASEAVSATRSFNFTVQDVSLASDALSMGKSITLVVHCEAVASDDLQLDEEPFTTFVLNSRNMAISEYTNFKFTSYAAFNGRYFATGPDGLYELTSDTDAGFLIKAILKSGIIDFDNEFQKRIPRMYAGLRSNGECVLKTITNENVVRWYSLQKSPQGIAETRAKVSKGPKSVYWQFEFANIDGKDFELESIKLMPITLTRRIKAWQ